MMSTEGYKLFELIAALEELASENSKNVYAKVMMFNHDSGECEVVSDLVVEENEETSEVFVVLK